MYTQPCVSGRDRKTKPARWPVDPRARDIRVYKNRFQPPDCVPDIPPTPDILHGSYLGKTEQSPASSHNTPVLSHTRSVSIAAEFLYVKKNFVISGENFLLFLCTAPKMISSRLQGPFLREASPFLPLPTYIKRVHGAVQNRSLFHEWALRAS